MTLNLIHRLYCIKRSPIKPAIRNSIADNGKHDPTKDPNNKKQKKETIFDKARQKTKEKYQNLTTENYEKAKSNELHDIKDINYLEKKASKSFKNSIQCKTKCFWRYILTDDGRIAFEFGTGILAILIFIQICLIGELSLKQWFYKFFKNLFSSSFYCFVILSINLVISLFKRNFRSKSRAFFISWLVTIVLCLPHIPVLFGYETNQIGAFYEATNYKAKYYVTMSREPNSKTNRKAYTLPAEIERREDYMGTETYHSSTHYIDGETYESDIYALNYHINYLYFPNGGYLFFDYDEAYENPKYSTVALNQETKVTDYHGDNYYITLTSKKVQ